MDTIDERGAFIGDPDYLISASFDSFRDAEAATSDLIGEGFPRERMSVLLSEEARSQYLEIHPEYAETEGHVLAQTVELDEESKALKGAGVGGALGGTLGAAAAVLAVGSSIVIPALGLIVAGPIAAALVGAGAGGAAGTLIGALTGAGLSEFRAKRFEQLISDGRVVVSARALTDPERTTITRILERHDGDLIPTDHSD
jgi:hypothetical protein